jgi:hypothetical protein
MKKLFLLFAACMLMASCTTESYVANYQNFVDKTEMNGNEYSLNDWAKSIKKFKKYGITEFAKKQRKLTGKQRVKVIKLDARYVGILLRDNAIQGYKLVKELRSFAPDVLEEILQGKKSFGLPDDIYH